MSADQWAEMQKYMSAMIREVGEFRAEARKQHEETRAEMRELNKKVDATRAEVIELRTGLLEVRTEVHIIASRLDRLEARSLDRAALRDIDERVTVLESK